MTAARYAIQLVMQGRPDLAEPELRRALASDPDDPDLHVFLALALTDLGRSGEGLAEAERGVGLEPGFALAHYARAAALLDLDRGRDAEAAAREAIRLDPHDVGARVVLAAALLGRRQRDEALAVTDEALALDPEHAGAANMRAQVLVALGRRDEAAATVEGVLARNPESAHSHANRGWTLLHQNRPRDAMAAFREALRLEPDDDWARSGIVEAMKARNPIYRGLLAYFLWMSRLSSGTRWAIVVGGYLAAQVIPGALWVYLPLVLLTWMGDSLFNLLLFLDPFGRLVLSRDERQGATLLAACIGLGLALAVAGFVTLSVPLTWTGVGVFGLALPIGGIYNRLPTRRRRAWLYTGAVVLLGAAALGAALMGRGELASTLGFAYAIGLAAFTWLANLFTR